jgi:predicted sugar kinase
MSHSIELAAPACLLLGLSPSANGPVAVGLALQHPPVAIIAEPSPMLEVSGAAFHVGQSAARRLSYTGNIEIELAPPLLMGLGAEPLLQLSVARALAEVSGASTDAHALSAQLGLDPLAALETAAFTHGGLLQVNVTAPEAATVRLPLAHHEDQAWVVVFFLPRPAEDDPDSLEAERRAALLAAAPHLSPETGRVLTEHLWPAAARDDFTGFASAVAALHQLNAAALAAAGRPLIPRPDAQAVLDLLRAEGVPACGQTLTGLGVFALIQGAQPSRDLRKKLMALVGHAGGTVMATITDNDGCRIKHTT